MAHFTGITKEDLTKSYGFSYLKGAILLETAGKEAGLAVVHIRTLLDRPQGDASEKLRLAIIAAQERARLEIDAALKEYDSRFE